MTTENQTTLTAAELIENEHGRFHPELLPLPEDGNVIEWVKQRGLKVQIVEVEDTHFYMSEWNPISNYEGAVLVAVFRTNEFEPSDYTAVFAYEDTSENRQIKLKRLGVRLERDSGMAAVYIKTWYDNQIADIEEAARAKSNVVRIGDVEITDPAQIKWLTLGMKTAVGVLNDCPVDVDWNR